jgi:hypothetical protein
MYEIKFGRKLFNSDWEVLKHSESSDPIRLPIAIEGSSENRFGPGARLDIGDVELGFIWPASRPIPHLTVFWNVDGIPPDFVVG